MLNKKFLDQANFELQVRKNTSVLETNVNVINFCPKPVIFGVSMCHREPQVTS